MKGGAEDVGGDNTLPKKLTERQEDRRGQAGLTCCTFEGVNSPQCPSKQHNYLDELQSTTLATTQCQVHIEGLSEHPETSEDAQMRYGQEA